MMIQRTPLVALLGLVCAGAAACGRIGYTAIIAVEDGWLPDSDGSASSRISGLTARTTAASPTMAE